jgi:hypothetical protein
MNRRTFLIVGILLVILGIVLFVERGFFASTFLGASVLGNMDGTTTTPTRSRQSLLLGVLLSLPEL